MSKINPVNRALETIYKLSLDKSFRKEIKLVRERLKIPVNGFTDRDAYMKNLYTFIPDLNDLIDEIIILLKKYQLPFTYWIEFSEYIKFGSLYYDGKVQDQLISIEYPNLSNSNHSVGYERFNKPYVRIYILDGWAKEDVIKSIRNNWVEIKKSLQAQGGTNTRVRISLNKERNHLILQLSEMSKNDLAKMINADIKLFPYKEVLISKVLKEKYKVNVSSDIVKKYSHMPKIKSTDK